MRTTLRLAVCAASVLAAAARADATIYRVGPAGQYATIQQALTAAATAGSSTASHDVRVQNGTYAENLRLPSPCCGGRSIRVSGAWNALFNVQGFDPATTVIDGRDRGRVLTAIEFRSGQLMLDRLTLRKGRLRTTAAETVATGAGVYGLLGESARLVLFDAVVRDNTIRATAPHSGEAMGAGVHVVLNDASSLSVHGTRFQNNLIVEAGAALASYGGGLAVEARNDARLTVQRSAFVGNWAYGSRLSYGGAVFATGSADGLSVSLEDSSFEGNVVSPIGLGSAVELRTVSGTASAARITRCRFLANVGGDSQLDTSAGSGTRIDVNDTLVARGGAGVKASVHGGTTSLVNLTVADNDLRGVVGSATTGQLRVFNTIAWGNAGGDFSLAGAGVLQSHNLVGEDPLFQPGTYELGGASPAADAGTNSVRTGLDDLDLARRDRVYNGTVDIGAYEWYPY